MIFKEFFKKWKNFKKIKKNFHNSQTVVANEMLSEKFDIVANICPYYIIWPNFWPDFDFNFGASYGVWTVEAFFEILLAAIGDSRLSSDRVKEMKVLVFGVGPN